MISLEDYLKLANGRFISIEALMRVYGPSAVNELVREHLFPIQPVDSPFSPDDESMEE
jgi:hypothetical protein